MKAARIIALAFAMASADYSITDIMDDQDKSSQQAQSTGPVPLDQSSATPTPISSGAAGITPLEASLQQPQHSSAASAAATPAQMPAGNPMQTLLSSMVTPQQGQQLSASGQPSTMGAGVQPFNPLGAKPLNGELSQDSMAVVSGLVESFMHKVALQPGERSCLERNVGQLTGDIMGTVGDVVTAIEALVQGKGTIQKQNTGGVVSAGIDSAMKITSLVALSTQLVRNCVHGDALALLKETAHHLINGTYLEHRFIVNGVDIAHSLSDSVVAFESKDFHRFGSDIGFALRKDRKSVV